MGVNVNHYRPRPCRETSVEATDALLPDLQQKTQVIGTQCARIPCAAIIRVGQIQIGVDLRELADIVSA
jgi:hypothetical protein